MSISVLVLLTAGGPPLVAAAATAGPPADGHCVVVDEVNTSSPGTHPERREYFELRNVCADPVDISGYRVKIFVHVHGVEALIVDYPVPGTDAAPTTLAAKNNLNVGTPAHADQFWTVRHAYSPGSPAGFDDTYSMAANTLTDVPEEFSLELHDGELIDAVCTDLASARGEGVKAMPEPFGSSYSVSRNSLSTDTNTNALDFGLWTESPSAPSGTI